MKNVLVIGLTGLPRVGKDTLADTLVEKFGFTKLSFAAALYQEVSEAYEVPVELLQSHEYKTTPQRSLCVANCSSAVFREILRAKGYQTFEPITSRVILQLWGTEYRRHNDPHYWTNKLHVALRNQLCPWDNKFVISDCRAYSLADGSLSYEEAEYVQKWKGLLFEVTHNNAVSNGHSSDTPFPRELISGVIHNDGSIEDLEAKAVETMGLV